MIDHENHTEQQRYLDNVATGAYFSVAIAPGPSKPIKRTAEQVAVRKAALVEWMASDEGKAQIARWETTIGLDWVTVQRHRGIIE